MTQFTGQARTTKPTNEQRNIAAGSPFSAHEAFVYEEFEKEADATWLASERAKLHHRARRAVFR